MRESKEIRDLMVVAEERGARVEDRNSQYTVFPSSRDDRPFSVPHGPRGTRSIKNVRAKLKRLGLV